MKHMAALSPSRSPVLMMRVYPPGRSMTLDEISVKSSFTAYLSCNEEKTIRCECTDESFDLVISGSMYFLSDLALAVVVKMRLCLISDEAMFASIASRCALVRPK